MSPRQTLSDGSCRCLCCLSRFHSVPPVVCNERNALLGRHSTSQLMGSILNRTAVVCMYETLLNYNRTIKCWKLHCRSIRYASICTLHKEWKEWHFTYLRTRKRARMIDRDRGRQCGPERDDSFEALSYPWRMHFCICVVVTCRCAICARVIHAGYRGRPEN